MLRPADSAAKLVELGKAEPIGSFYHHYSGIRHVHAHLNYRRGNQNIDFARSKARHNLRLFRALHPPMKHRDFQVRKDFFGKALVFFGNVFYLQPELFADVQRLLGGVGRAFGGRDPGANYEGLPTGFDLLFDEIIGLFTIARRHDFGDYLLPAAW